MASRPTSADVLRKALRSDEYTRGWNDAMDHAARIADSLAASAASRPTRADIDAMIEYTSPDGDEGVLPLGHEWISPSGYPWSRSFDLHEGSRCAYGVPGPHGVQACGRTPDVHDRVPTP